MPLLACGPTLATVAGMRRPTLAEQIKAARERAGITQAELAELAGFSSQTNVSRLEAGTHGPRLESLQRIAQALRVDLVIHWQQ